MGGLALRSLHIREEWDRYLAEPDQPITQSVTLENHSRLSIPFVRLVLGFPGEAKPVADAAWCKSHRRDTLLAWNAEYRMTLRGRRSMTRTVTVSIPQRGVYKMGAYHLSAGDLLGFREAKCHGDGQRIVVMPHRSRQKLHWMLWVAFWEIFPSAVLFWRTLF
jgi:hypothetical protein